MLRIALNSPQKPVPEIMSDILAATACDIIKVIEIDDDVKATYETETLDLSFTPCGADAFSYRNLKPVISLFGASPDPVLLSGDGGREGDAAIHKLNGQFAQELYIPLCDCHQKTAGIVYLAKKEGAMSGLQSEGFLNPLRMLLKIQEEEIMKQRKKDELYDTVLLLCELVNAKEPFIISKLYSVLFWATKIARRMSAGEDQVQKLQLASLMHDFGKIYIDDRILNKEGNLTPEEYEIVKSRVMHSYDIALRLARLYELDGVPQIILMSQERMDGKGYPSGIPGEKIPLLSKILYVAKAIAAMLTNKAYQKARTITEVISELRKNAGRQFDGEVVEAATVELIYHRDEYPDYFSGFGVYATMSLTLADEKETTLNLWGNVRKQGNSFVFTPVTKLSLGGAQLNSCYLYLSANDTVIKYKPEIKAIEENQIVFASLENQKENSMFSIRWTLEGIFIAPDKTTCSITIVLLGGDYLDFYVFEDQVKKTMESGIVIIKFDEEKNIFLPGVISSRQKMEDKVFYRFKYTNVTDMDRQYVFSAMFQKQLEVKGLIKDTNYFKRFLLKSRQAETDEKA